ncbi:hypothetical protein [Ligilactobacillus agilis]
MEWQAGILIAFPYTSGGTLFSGTHQPLPATSPHIGGGNGEFFHRI